MEGRERKGKGREFSRGLHYKWYERASYVHQIKNQAIRWENFKRGQGRGHLGPGSVSTAIFSHSSRLNTTDCLYLRAVSVRTPVERQEPMGKEGHKLLQSWGANTALLNLLNGGIESLNDWLFGFRLGAVERNSWKPGFNLATVFIIDGESFALEPTFEKVRPKGKDAWESVESRENLDELWEIPDRTWGESALKRKIFFASRRRFSASNWKCRFVMIPNTASWPG